MATKVIGSKSSVLLRRQSSHGDVVEASEFVGIGALTGAFSGDVYVTGGKAFLQALSNPHQIVTYTNAIVPQARSLPIVAEFIAAGAAIGVLAYEIVQHAAQRKPVAAKN